LLFSSLSGFLLSVFWLALPANAQQTGPPQTPERSNPIPEVRTTPGAGNLPSSVFDPSSLIRQNLPGAARTSPAPAQLSLTDAIQLALQNNLATLSAQEQRREATGFVQQARSALLPNISGATYQGSRPSSAHSTISTRGRDWSKPFLTSARFVITSQAAKEYAVRHFCSPP
jgi:outer membrane protein TolC